MLSDIPQLLLLSVTLTQQAVYGVIIGLVQGISEWLPVSSKTQVLVAATYLLHLSFQQAYSFGLFMDIGSVAAAIIYFRKELYYLVQVLLGSKDAMKRKLFVYVLVATVVTGVIGAPLYLITDKVTGIDIGIPMLVMGAILIADSVLIWHSRKARSKGTRKLDGLGMKDFILIGIAQGIAALPGVSRSGTTTSAMLLMDVEPDEAFRLSFTIGIFAAIAAFGLTLVASHANVSASIAEIGVYGFAIAVVVATLVSLVFIDFLIKVAGKSQIVYVTAALGMVAIAGGAIYLLSGVA